MKDKYDSVRATVFVIDHENLKFAKDLVADPKLWRKNQDTKAMLCAWLKLKDKLPFLVAGFFPGKVGVTGGLSKDWHSAMQLCALVKTRLDEKAGTSFNSAWMVCITDQRRHDLLRFLAESQQCCGAA